MSIAGVGGKRFAMFSNGEDIMLKQDDLCFTFKNCYLTQYEVHVEPHLMDITTRGDSERSWRQIAPMTRISMEFIVGGETLNGEHLGLADDMTVRELLALVNKKLAKRGKEK